MPELREVSEGIIRHLAKNKMPRFFTSNTPVFIVDNLPEVEIDITGWYGQLPIIREIKVDGVSVLSFTLDFGN